MTYHLDSEANIGINDLIYGKADAHEKYYAQSNDIGPIFMLRS